jgi:cytochrome c oxidase assembly factor CtaG
MQASLFAAGIGCLVLALMSPLCRMASTLASAHMVQHVLLVAGAPLLLALSHPGRVLMEGLPARIRKRAAVWTGAPSVPPRPAFLLVSFLLYGVNIWFWHVPALYEAALLDAGMHLTMVCALLITSLLFWHAILATYRVPGTASATAAMLLFFTFLHTGALGIFLTLAPRIWYPLVALRSATWDILPLDDQRLAGLIMWIPMGGIYFVAGLAILARLISSAGRMSQKEARG